MKITYDNVISRLRFAVKDEQKLNELIQLVNSIILTKQFAYKYILENEFIFKERYVYEAVQLEQIEVIGLQFGNGLAEILNFMWNINKEITNEAIIQTTTRKDLLVIIAKTINSLLSQLANDDKRRETLENFKDYLLEQLKKQFGKKL